jgi:hypothetical protein
MSWLTNFSLAGMTETPVTHYTLRRVKLKIVLLIAMAGLIGLLSFCILSDLMSSARRSDRDIRDELLDATALGSSEAAVYRYATAHFERDNFFHWSETETGKQLQALYGCYSTIRNFPLPTCVRVTWVFNNDHKLVDIRLARWIDGP